MQKFIRRNNNKIFVRQFSKKNPAPEEGQLEVKKHVNEAQVKFKKLMRWEVLPVIGLTVFGVIYYKFQTQLQNLLPSSYFEAISVKQDRFINRKLASLLKYQYCTTKGVANDTIEVQILTELYGYLTAHLNHLNLTNIRASRDSINLFYSDSKYNVGKNYFEFFILSNGALFISEPLLEEIL